MFCDGYTNAAVGMYSLLAGLMDRTRQDYPQEIVPRHHED